MLRSERGLTYGAEADTQAFKQAGDFVAETNTRTETTAETLRLTVEEIASFSVSVCSSASCRMRRRIWPAFADDRDAQRHRDERHQQRLLRAADRRSRELSRARPGDYTG